MRMRTRKMIREYLLIEEVNCGLAYHLRGLVRLLFVDADHLPDFLPWHVDGALGLARLLA